MRPVDESEIRIRLMALPHRVSAFTLRDEEGFYNIYVNDRLMPEQQQKAIRHELHHIEHGDFDGGDMDALEFLAHGQ